VMTCGFSPGREAREKLEQSRFWRLAPGLIPFPTLSMMLRSGPTVASAAALWITRPDEQQPLWTSCRWRARVRIVRVWLCMPDRKTGSFVPHCSHGHLGLSPRGSPEDHRSVMRRLFRCSREHRPSPPRRRIRRLLQGSVSGQQATGTGHARSNSIIRLRQAPCRIHRMIHRMIHRRPFSDS
jgi:hypothetical protein